MGTSTATSGTIDLINNQVNANPGAASSSAYRAYVMSAQVTNGNAQDFSGSIRAIQIEMRHRGTGSITQVYGGVVQGFVAGNSFSTVTRVDSWDIQPVSISGSPTGTVTTAVGLNIRNSSVGAGPLTIGTQIGIDIGSLVSGTSDIGIRIAKADTYSLQLSDTSQTAAGGITFGTDTNLYRSAADTLTTDDAFLVNIGSLTGVTNSVRITGTLAHALTNQRALHVDPTFTGTVNGVGGMGVQPTIQPPNGTTISTAYGLIMLARANPLTGGTVSILHGGFFRIDSGSSGGTFGQGNGLSVATASLGSITPSTLRGIDIQSLYPTSGSITNVIGIQIQGQRAGTGVNDGLRVQYGSVGVGIANTTTLYGINLPTASVTLGDTTGTTTNAHGVFIGIPTWTSTTNTRTITNAAGLYIAGAPVASTNVSITNGPYSVWIDDGTTRLDGDLDHRGTNIGFYGVTPTSRQVLATGAGATVDQVITALQNLGLLAQS